MPIIKSTLQAAQDYVDYSKLTKGKPTQVATLVHGDNNVSQKQFEKLITLSVFKSQIESGALVVQDAKTEAAKEKAEQEAAAQKLIDEAAGLAEGGR